MAKKPQFKRPIFNEKYDRSFGQNYKCHTKRNCSYVPKPTKQATGYTKMVADNKIKVNYNKKGWLFSLTVRGTMDTLKCHKGRYSSVKLHSAGETLSQYQYTYRLNERGRKRLEELRKKREDQRA